MNTVTCIKLKAAWIRDDVPPGAPALGRFDCECGRQVKPVRYYEGGPYPCECGLIYRNDGYILNRKETLAEA